MAGLQGKFHWQRVNAKDGQARDKATCHDQVDDQPGESLAVSFFAFISLPILNKSRFSSSQQAEAALIG